MLCCSYSKAYFHRCLWKNSRWQRKIRKETESWWQRISEVKSTQGVRDSLGGRGRSDCQGHNCKVVIKKKQSAIWKWDLDDFSHAGWVSLVKGYNRVEVKGKGRICGKREDTTPKVKYYKKKGLSHTAPFPFLSFPKHTRRCQGEFFRTCSHKLFGLRSIVKSVFIPNCFLITLSPFTWTKIRVEME